ncbi:MAG: DNA polymerase III subunit epsilon [Buchnera aphidicola (Eriosoma harunire)]
MNIHTCKQIVLDTETTGFNTIGVPYIGHKIIEIGAVTLENRQITGEIFHVYLQPNRSIDHSAFLIHGISNNYLLGKPQFIDIANKFLNYIKGQELIIHNANFDISFLDYELQMLHVNFPKIKNICSITDTLSIARKKFPGKKNNLNALCSRYKIPIDRSHHSAMLDAKILAKIYLLMTSDQESIDFSKNNMNKFRTNYDKNNSYVYNTSVLFPNSTEIENHNEYLKYMKNTFGKCLWIDMSN